MKNQIVLDSKLGTYILYYDDQRIDIGDYLEVEFTGKFWYEEATFLSALNKPVIKGIYDIKIHFSAIHNENNTLETTFVSCSKFVNKYIPEHKSMINRIIPMSVTHVSTRKWTWWWPKFDGKEMSFNLFYC